MIKSRIAIMAGVPALLICTGCASFSSSFRDHSLPPVTPWPLPQAKPQQSISVTIGSGSFLEELDDPEETQSRRYIPAAAHCIEYGPYRKKNFKCQKREKSPSPAELPGMQTIKAYQDSGLFSEVRTDAAQTDLKAVVKIISRERPKIAVIMTLGIIPAPALSHKVTVHTTIKDRQGKILGRFSKTETGTTWESLFQVAQQRLSGTLPNIIDKVEYDLSQAIIVEARAKGIF